MPPLGKNALLLVAATVGVAVLIFVIRRLLRRQAPQPATETMPSIDVAALADTGPPREGAVLEFYHVPVRLAVLVLAPVGREGTLPERQQLRDLVEELLPGLSDVLDSHQPVFRRWPAQLSSTGFARAFSAHVRLPGDAGKGTCWCSIAGRFRAGSESYLAGLVCCADRPNSHGQVAIESEGQWLDVLRVRRDK